MQHGQRKTSHIYSILRLTTGMILRNNMKKCLTKLLHYKKYTIEKQMQCSVIFYILKLEIC